MATTAGDSSGVMKIELFAQYITGDIWIDQLEVVEDYTLSMDQQQVSLKIGETAQLKAMSSNPETDLRKLEWTSFDPSVVSVDSNGNVTALKLGVVEISAKLDNSHIAKCIVKVSDSDVEEPYYTEMRGRQTERLTGNSYWHGENTSEEYKQIVYGYDKETEEILKLFVGNNNEKLFSDLELNPATRNPNSTSSDDSVAFSTAMERINRLAKAWASKGSRYYQNEELKNKILYAMEWSYDHFYSDKLDNKAMFGNWWHWWIGIPQNLAGTVILMHDVMSEELLAKEAATLANFSEDPAYVYKVKGVGGGKMDMTAANLADTSLVSLLRGVACSDQQAVSNGTKYFGQIAQVVTSGEGIYPDGSFIQHTNLAYMGGYGLHLAQRRGKIGLFNQQYPLTNSGGTIKWCIQLDLGWSSSIVCKWCNVRYGFGQRYCTPLAH